MSKEGNVPQHKFGDGLINAIKTSGKHYFDLFSSNWFIEMHFNPLLFLLHMNKHNMNK